MTPESSSVVEGDTPPTGEGSTTASDGAISESLKTRAMDEAPVGITVADATSPETPLVYANAAFERITGYRTADVIGRNCRFLQGEATRAEPVAQMRSAIEEEAATSVVLRNYRRDGELFWNEVTLAPLRGRDGTVTHYVGFQQDVTRRKRAERAAARRATRIERERAAQEHLLDRLDGVVTDLTGAVTRAASRQTLECGAVRSLADAYAGAWIGRYDPARDAIVPRVVAGATAGEVASRRFSTDDAADPVASALSGALDGPAVRIEPLDPDEPDEPAAVASVPLHYGDATYGAFCVYTGNPDGFRNHERGVLAALGRTVATGINALESQRTLHADETVELRFAAYDDHPLVDLASGLDCRLAYAGRVEDRDRPAALFDLTGADVGAVREAVADGPVDLHAAIVEGDDACLVELSVADATFHDLLADYGAELRDATIDGDGGRFTVEVSRESLARSMVDAVADRFEGWDLRGYRQCERRTRTRREFVAALEADLTDRQHAALVRASTGGYFEWPREATGDDIAAAMGVCRSTFHQHLRAAQRKLIGAILDQ